MHSELQANSKEWTVPATTLSLPVAIDLIQISDTHLFESDENRHGVNARACVQHVVDTLVRGPRPDAIILTGDLIHDDKSESYELLRQILAPLHTKVFALAGNHDTPAMNDVFPLPLHAHCPLFSSSVQRPFAIDLDGWRLILLDSQREGEVGGDLDREQLVWLDEILTTSPRSAVAFVHHPPGATGVAWIDDHGVINANALAPVIEKHRPTLKHIFFGHVHGAISLQVGGVSASSCPSTAHAFGDGVYASVTSDTRPPSLAFNAIRLDDDGRVTSRIVFAGDDGGRHAGVA